MSTDGYFNVTSPNPGVVYHDVPSNTVNAELRTTDDARIVLGLDPVGRRRADREVREQLQKARAALARSEQLHADARAQLARWKGMADEMAGQRDDYQRLLAGCKRSLDTARSHAENWRSMYAHALDRAAGTCTAFGPFRIFTVVSARDLTTTVSVSLFGKQIFESTIR